MKEWIYVYKSLRQLVVDVSRYFQNVRNLPSKKVVTWDAIFFQFFLCKLTPRWFSSSPEEHFHFAALTESHRWKTYFFFGRFRKIFSKFDFRAKCTKRKLFRMKSSTNECMVGFLFRCKIKKIIFLGPHTRKITQWKLADFNDSLRKVTFMMWNDVTSISWHDLTW